MPPIELHVEVTHLHDALAGLAHDGERLGEQRIEGFALLQAILEFIGLGAERLVGEGLEGRFETLGRPHVGCGMSERLVRYGCREGA